VQLNPQTIRWTDPSTRQDGSPFGASDFRAYELGAASNPTADPVALLALPTAYGTGSSPIPSQVSDTRNVSQFLALRTLDNLGLTSAWSNRVEVAFAVPPMAVGDFSAA
jgi:hypothetical protein